MTPPAPEPLQIQRRGGGYLLTSRQWVPVSLERCFAFFSDAANLEALTPPTLGFEIRTPLPITMAVGTRITYRLHLLGSPMRWVSLIDQWDPMRGFSDTQLEGPYARWIHRHGFEAADDGTWVTDEVDYALPFGRLAAPAHALFVAPQLRWIFRNRRQAMLKLLA